MNSDLQTWLALAIVALVAFLLVRSSWRKRHQAGCGGGCGCPTDDFKKHLKAARRP